MGSIWANVTGSLTKDQKDVYGEVDCGSNRKNRG